MNNEKCAFFDDDGNEITKCVSCGIEISPHTFVLEDECFGKFYKVDILKCKQCGALSFGWYKIND